MSGALMNKVWDLFGMDTAEQEEYEDENIYDYENEEEYDAECEWNLLAVNADGAAEAGETVQKVKVAVLDSGVDYVTGINLAGYVNLVEGEEELSEIFQRGLFRESFRRGESGAVKPGHKGNLLVYRT